MDYKKVTVYIIILTTVLFVCFVLIDRINSRDLGLKKSSEIDLYVDKVSDYKGILLLNDSVVISKNCPKIKSSNLTVGHITKPFRIIKKANNDTIKIVKQGNVSYYLLLEL